MEEIKCSRCGQLKSVKEFYKSKTNKTGYESICKQCRKNRYTHICPICNKEFKNDVKNAIYCSKKCRGESMKGENNVNYKPKVECKCDYCGQDISIKQSKYDYLEHHFCNRNCYSKWKSTSMKGENNPFYGKHLSKEARNKISLSMKGRFAGENNYFYGKRYIGKDNPNYNPNLTDEEREMGRIIEGYYEFRNNTYKRDNYTCQCCGDKKGGNLNAHHIYGYAEYKDLRINVNNSITLCEECHKEYHKQYGYKNNNWKDFRTFLFYKWKDTNNLFCLRTIENIDLRLIPINEIIINKTIPNQAS